MSVPGVLVVWTGNKPCLVVHPLGADGFVIGRETIGIETTDDRISRQHARVRSRGGQIEITDLASRNGTYAGGHAVVDATRSLPPPAVIRTGRTVSVAIADVTPYEQGTFETHGERVIGPIVRAVIAQLETAIETRTSTLIIGERGSGRSTLVRASFTGNQFDGRRGDDPEFLDLAKPGVPLLVTDVDKLGTEFRDRVKELRYSGTFVLATATRDLGAIDPGLIERFESSIAMPPLRDRFDELPTIVDRTSRAVAPALAVHATLCEACLLRPWPGNVPELIEAVSNGAARRQAEGKPDVRGDDLDPAEVVVRHHADCLFPGYVPPERRRRD